LRKKTSQNFFRFRQIINSILCRTRLWCCHASGVYGRDSSIRRSSQVDEARLKKN